MIKSSLAKQYFYIIIIYLEQYKFSNKTPQILWHHNEVFIKQY